jgi:hypothetical protein
VAGCPGEVEITANTLVCGYFLRGILVTTSNSKPKIGIDLFNLVNNSENIQSQFFCRVIYPNNRFIESQEMAVL